MFGLLVLSRRYEDASSSTRIHLISGFPVSDVTVNHCKYTGQNGPREKKDELTLIGLSLLPEFPGGLDSRFSAILVQVLVAHDFTAHELVLEIRAMK